MVSPPQKDVDLQPGCLYKVNHAAVYMSGKLPTELQDGFSESGVFVEPGDTIMYLEAVTGTYINRTVGGCSFIVGDRKLYMWVTRLHEFQDFAVTIRDNPCFKIEEFAKDYLETQCGQWAVRIDE